MKCKHYTHPGWCANKTMSSPVCRWGEWPDCRGFVEVKNTAPTAKKSHCNYCGEDFDPEKDPEHRVNCRDAFKP